MPRKSEPAQIVPRTREHMGEDFKRMIAQAIEEKVAEALSDETGAIFQPFFQSQEIARAIRRSQTVQEQQKFIYYFDTYGCLVCESQDHRHHSLGMCKGCYNTRRGRLAALVRDHTPPPEVQPTFMDTVRLAHAALAPSIEVLAGKILPSKRELRTQKEAAREAGIDPGTLTQWLKARKVEHPRTKLSATKWLWDDQDIARLKETANAPAVSAAKVNRKESILQAAPKTELEAMDIASLAQAAGVCLSSVKIVIGDLVKEGLLSRIGKGTKESAYLYFLTGEKR